jgi:hypothetical protein
VPQALGHPVAFDDLGEVRQSVVDTDDVARGPRLLRSSRQRVAPMSPIRRSAPDAPIA